MSSLDDVFARRPDKGVEGLGSHPRARRARYLAAIAAFALAWIMVPALPPAVAVFASSWDLSLLRVGFAVLGIALMAAGWLLMPGRLGRRTAALGLVVGHTLLTWALLGWHFGGAYYVYPTKEYLGLELLFVPLFLLAWLWVREASARAYLALIPVAAFSVITATAGVTLIGRPFWWWIWTTEPYTAGMVAYSWGLVGVGVLVGSAWGAHAMSSGKWSEAAKQAGP